MKLRLAAVVFILLLSLLALTACDLLGGKKSKEQELYERQIEALQKQQEAARKAQEEYDAYYRQVQEDIKRQLERASGNNTVTVTANQTTSQ
jgi:hypothetical protein